MHRTLRNYGYAWVTLGFFLISLSGHLVFAWFAYVNEQLSHQMPIQFSDYAFQATRDILENWQSEFLQLLWQVGGLAILLHVGSPQSKEGDDRMEAKLDALLRAVRPEDADKLIKHIDDLYLGRETDKHTEYHPHWE
jgi:Domain of unknown function (DUF6766)